MSKKNREMVYNKLVAEGRLHQDDGSLEKEFGCNNPPTPPTKDKKEGKK